MQDLKNLFFCYKSKVEIIIQRKNVKTFERKSAVDFSSQEKSSFIARTVLKIDMKSNIDLSVLVYQNKIRIQERNRIGTLHTYVLKIYWKIRNFVIEGVACQPPASHSSITNFLTGKAMQSPQLQLNVD